MPVDNFVVVTLQETIDCEDTVISCARDWNAKLITFIVKEIKECSERKG